MNDHNLDDLIVDDIKPKSTKTKSFLTIIALLIIVLITTIILTKMILDDATPLEESNSTAMLSPELALQPSTKPAPKHQEPTLSDLSAHEPSAPKEQATPSTTAPTPHDAQNYQRIREERIKAEKQTITPQAGTQHTTTTPDTTPKQPTPATTPTPTKAPKKHPVTTTHAPRGHYFIQVGSFRQTPSKRFLSTINKHGFHHTITKPNRNGIKRLLIGPYTTKSSANHALPKVKDLILKGAFVTKR